jgi:hypothetical protein
MSGVLLDHGTPEPFPVRTVPRPGTADPPSSEPLCGPGGPGGC